VSEAFYRLGLSLLYDFDAIGEGADADQFLHWMLMITEAISDLGPEERRDFIRVAQQLASQAEAEGDLARASAYRRVAEAEANRVR